MTLFKKNIFSCYCFLFLFKLSTYKFNGSPWIFLFDIKIYNNNNVHTYKKKSHEHLSEK